jgi:hypothetical protein
VAPAELEEEGGVAILKVKVVVDAEGDGVPDFARHALHGDTMFGKETPVAVSEACIRDVEGSVVGRRGPVAPNGIQRRGCVGLWPEAEGGEMVDDVGECTGVEALLEGDDLLACFGSHWRDEKGG